MQMAYDLCDTPASCMSVKRHGLAAVARHPPFFPHTSCITPALRNHSLGPGGPCHPRRMYLHFLCVGGLDQKVGGLQW